MSMLLWCENCKTLFYFKITAFCFIVFVYRYIFIGLSSKLYVNILSTITFIHWKCVFFHCNTFRIKGSPPTCSMKWMFFFNEVCSKNSSIFYGISPLEQLGFVNELSLYFVECLIVLFILYTKNTDHIMLICLVYWRYPRRSMFSLRDYWDYFFLQLVIVTYSEVQVFYKKLHFQGQRYSC